jgi:SH3 domain protein
MLREIMGLGLAVILTFFLATEPKASQVVYVTDFQKITLRTGPSLDNKILAFLVSGQALEVIENQDKWSRVKVVDEGGVEREGWVLSQFLTEQRPYKLQVNALVNENRMLKDRLEPLKEQLEKSVSQEKTLSINLKKTEETLNNLQKEFATLKKGASEYLALKAEYDKTQANLIEKIQQNKILNAENKKLKESERNKWFLSGALVLFLGLLVGLMFGRQQKKRKSTYY